MSPVTPPETVEKLQKSLHAKAKAEPNFRFFSLWDKVYRDDVLRYAYRVCRANDGAPGVDGESFQQIEAHGLEDWLGNLQKELRDKEYAPVVSGYSCEHAVSEAATIVRFRVGTTAVPHSRSRSISPRYAQRRRPGSPKKLRRPTPACSASCGFPVVVVP